MKINRIPVHTNVWHDARISLSDYIESSVVGFHFTTADHEKDSGVHIVIAHEAEEIIASGLMVNPFAETIEQRLIAKHRRDGSWDVLRKLVVQDVFNSGGGGHVTHYDLIATRVAEDAAWKHVTSLDARHRPRNETVADMIEPLPRTPPRVASPRTADSITRGELLGLFNEVKPRDTSREAQGLAVRESAILRSEFRKIFPSPDINASVQTKTLDIELFVAALQPTLTNEDERGDTIRLELISGLSKALAKRNRVL